MASQKRLFGDLAESSEKVGSSASVESIMLRLSSLVSEEKGRVMRIRYGELRCDDKGVPRACDCGAQVMVQTSHDPTTRGMQFVYCPYDISDGRGQGCGFRRVWNKAMQDEFAKIVDEHASLKDSLSHACEKIEDLEDRLAGIEDDGTIEQAVIDANAKLKVIMAKYDDLATKYESLNRLL